ncbi:MAG: SulP family inorganic anion transporter, partial [Verrucomicrobiae bacterium]|nr:SulP family inorganic anion transporter [Verrucomicrobiae bacterium]
TRLLIKTSIQRFANFIAQNGLQPLPIWGSFSQYGAPQFRADLKAATNVALLAFPQGMAYAAIADLPIQFGITSGAIAAIVAPLFAGSRHTILGPTNATAFMIYSSLGLFAAAERERLMPLLLLFVGLLLIFGALLRVADLIQYVSRSVVVGYISGAAVLIMANQISHALGMTMVDDSHGGARTFFTIVHSTVRSLGTLHWQAAVLAFATFAVWWLFLKRLRGIPVFASTLVLMSLVYLVLHRHFGWEVATFSPFEIGDLRPQWPSVTKGSLFHELSRLFGVAFSVAFLASLENSVMSKSLASQSGDRPDLNQDMLSVGMANVGSAFLGGMPASGSLTRSALNFASGAVSRLSSIISGLLCLVGVVVLGRYMDLVPKCVLAVLVMCIAASVVNRRHIRIALNATPSDAAVLLTTFISALLVPLNVAIFLGVGVSIMLYLRKASRPYLTEYEFNEVGELREAGEKRQRPIPAISIVHVEGELFFGAAELFRTQIQKICLDPDLRIVILRLKNARHLDATSVMALEELVRFVRSAGRDLLISGASKEVYRVLRNARMIEVIGRQNIFLASPRNPNLSTRNALKRAQEILGTAEADIRIYYDPNRSSG